MLGGCIYKIVFLGRSRFGRQVLLGHVNQYIECGWILNRKFAEHLAIQQNASALQATNKQTVSIVAHSARRGQAGDPK
jgi:hypothetical protein